MSSRPAYNHAVSFRYASPPNPSFEPVKGLKDSEFAQEWIKTGEEVGYTDVDPTTTDPRNIYRLLISGIVPRPIAFVSSIAEDGTENLAPFSYFNVMHADPPIIVIGFANGPTKKKDTCANILFNKTFTVNIISEPFAEAANWTCVDAPHDVDEWYGSGLTKEPSTFIKPSRVKESAFSMECELYEDIPLKHRNNPEKPTTGHVVLGLIKMIHVRNDILIRDVGGAGASAGSAPRAYTVDPAKLRAISRMGGITYGRIGEGFELPRPVWAEVGASYEGRVKEKTD